MYDAAVMNVQVFCFIKTPDGETLDDITFTLPLMKELGDQVHITTKVLTPLPGRFHAVRL